jgi:hypothetical protein
LQLWLSVVVAVVVAMVAPEAAEVNFASMQPKVLLQVQTRR